MSDYFKEDKDIDAVCIICGLPTTGFYPVNCTRDLKIPYCRVHLDETKNFVLSNADEDVIGAA